MKTDEREKFNKMWFEGYNGRDTQGQEKFGDYVWNWIESHQRQAVEEERERIRGLIRVCADTEVYDIDDFVDLLFMELKNSQGEE